MRLLEVVTRINTRHDDERLESMYKRADEEARKLNGVYFQIGSYLFPVPSLPLKRTKVIVDPTELDNFGAIVGNRNLVMHGHYEQTNKVLLFTRRNSILRRYNPVKQGPYLRNVHSDIN